MVSVRFISVISILFLGMATGMVHAQSPSYFDQVGYSKLKAQLGTATPTGAGVRVAQIEAHEGSGTNPDPDTADGRYDFKPDPTYYEFVPSMLFNVVAPAGTVGADISSHATIVVGRSFYGSTQSLAPGIREVDVYMAGNWHDANYLRVGSSYNPRSIAPGAATAARVASHAYIGTFGGAWDLESLERTDWLVDRDHFIQVVGTANGRNSAPQPEMASAYNVIRVGRLDGEHAIGTANAGGIYTWGRQGIDWVVPASSTSSAVGVGAAAAAFMVETGHARPSLSTGFETSRSGQTIHYAETSQVVRAALMAGADRNAVTAAHTADPYLRNSTNGLSTRYGAGLLNLYNSWHIIDDGEQNSAEDGGGTARREGWDFDTAFGGLNGSNATGVYTFTRPNAASHFAASLVWNAAVDIAKVVSGPNQNLNMAATVHDLNLALYQVTAGGDVLIQSSNSTNQNTENLWVPTLSSGDYKLIVSANGTFNTEYGLAWQWISTLTGDFNNDGSVNADDIDLLYANRGGSVDLYDLNDDGAVTNADVDHLLTNILNRRYGDSNLDGSVDTLDLLAFRANLGLSGAGWAKGNFTGDGTVDTADLSILRTNLGLAPPGFGGAPASSTGLNLDVTGDGLSSVPEPSSLALLALVGMTALRPGRRPHR
jgi:hypothetical protein